jgi:hypothetical protein
MSFSEQGQPPESDDLEWMPKFLDTLESLDPVEALH